MADALDEIGKKRLVIIGEVHRDATAIHLQRLVQQRLAARGRLHVIMEHFNFEMQPLLDKYVEGQATFPELASEYNKMEEGHEIEAYADLLEEGRKLNVWFHGGFLPRRFARRMMEGDDVLQEMRALGYVGPTDTGAGTDAHYSVFESCFTGRDLSEPPDQRFRRMFPAQVIKDVSMAHKVSELIKQDTEDTDSFLVICGVGHMLSGHGVPERIFSKVPAIEAHSTTVCTRLPDRKIGTTPADYWIDLEGEEAKEATAEAYDKVGETAEQAGNVELGRLIMKHLGYSEEHIQVAGTDAHNYQGVGCPHLAARLQPGEAVLDVGSGLGLDSYIAGHAVGSSGSVIGLDISAKEVEHAAKVAQRRGAENVEFVHGDMESMPFVEEQFHCVISNGAFCLAPNKQRAFREIYRVLKPGGRFSICTSVVKSSLDQQVKWPICMKMFSEMSELAPLCESIGFTEVRVDDSDGLMAFEIPGAEDMEPSERSKIHVGQAAFRHLENFDMNDLCARVVITGVKPA